MSDSDVEFYKNKRPDKTYVSRRLLGGLRIASKVLDCETYVQELQLRDQVILRTTSGGRQEIIAKFYEHDRTVHVLTLQRWNVEKGRPYEKQFFSFVGREIQALLTFIQNVTTLRFEGDEKINVQDSSMASVTITSEQARAILSANVELVVQMVESEITTKDVRALAYRRKELFQFESMLKDRLIGRESQWQQFFERNSWIFGHGLSYIFLDSLDGKKLEQTVRGFDVSQRGKRVDALMKTRAEVSSLCFVEVKRHNTRLLNSQPYRPGIWSPSADLVGGITQIQETVRGAVKALSAPFLPTNENGNPTGETLYGFEPKSYLVVGHLAEFDSEFGINEDKFRSFEVFRRNLRQPEIITFDELFHRAKFIVDHDV